MTGRRFVRVVPTISAKRHQDGSQSYIIEDNEKEERQKRSFDRREVDHLNWASHVTSLLTDDAVTALDVQTDPHECAFGKWLGGEERRAAERQIPSIAPLLKEIEQYHNDLHASAIEIGAHFKQADPMLPGLLEVLMGQLDDHRLWTGKVCRACVQEDASFEVQTDPTKCAFGKFLADEKCKQWCAEFPELKLALDNCRKPHEQRHASAAKIKNAFVAGDSVTAKKVYNEETVPALASVVKHFQAGIDAENAILAAQQKAKGIFRTETSPNRPTCWR